MTLATAIGIGADALSAVVCFAAPFVFVRILGERQFTAHRIVMAGLAVTTALRGVLHLVLVANAFLPMPALVAWAKVAAAGSLLMVAVLVARRVALFFAVIDRAETERDYVAVVGILKRLRAQARRHGDT